MATVKKPVGKPFPKGQSGNPGGRPKEHPDLRELARARTEEALKTLVSVMNDVKSPSSVRVSAAIAILDRGYGKPIQWLEQNAVITTKAVSKSDKEILDHYIREHHYRQQAETTKA